MIPKYIDKLQKIANLENTKKYFTTAFLCGAIFFGFFFYIFALYFLPLSDKVLFYLTLTGKIFLAMVILYYIWQSVQKSTSMLDIARKLDEKYNGDSDLFQNATEFYQNGEHDDFIAQIKKLSDEKIDRCEYTVDWKKTWIFGSLFVLSLAAFLLATQRNDFNRIWRLFYHHEIPKPIYSEMIDVVPGNENISKGQNLKIEVQNPDDLEYQIFIKRDKIWRKEALIDYAKIFSNLDYSFTYFIKNEFVISDTFAIDVYEKPIVTNIDVRTSYPKYMMKPDKEELQSAGSLNGYVGSDFEIEITANNPLDSAKIVIENQEIKLMERQGKSKFGTKISPNESSFYHFKIYDFLGNVNEEINREIILKNDNIPEIEIVYPGVDTLLAKNKLQGLKIVANDDFMLKEMKIFYKSDDNKDVLSESIVNDLGRKVVDIEYILDLSELLLLPDQSVSYWVEVNDNHPKTQIGKSKVYRLRMPSINEVLDLLEEQETQQQSQLEVMKEDMSKLEDELRKKRLELLKKDEFDWQDKKEIEQLMEQQQAHNEKMDQLAEAYEKMLEQYRDNEALAEETMEKMEKIQEMMEEISDETIKEAMEKLQESLKDMNEDDVRKALEDFEFSMEDYSEKLDQTLAMLEQIKKEQALSKTMEMLEEMQELQDQLTEDTNNSDNLSELSQDQKSLAEKSKKMEEQFENFQEMLNDNKDSQMKEDSEDVAAQMDSLQNQMQESMEQMQQNNKQQSQESQQSSQQTMKQMQKKMMNMQMQMSAGSAAEIGAAIQNATRELLLLSQFHNKVQERYISDPFTILTDEVAIFEGVQQSVRNLFAVPQIFMMIPPKFMMDLNKTSESFQDMFKDINDARNHRVPTFLKEIQNGLNQLVFDLMNANNSSQSGGGGGSMQQMMQQMQQMGQQQMMMNQLTQQMMQQMKDGKNGKASRETRQEGQKLGGEEQRLADNLKRMLQTNPEAQKQAHSIEKMIEELESVSKKLKSGQINRDLVEEQKNILSRMLEVQKSIHKRDKSKKRKAETAEQKIWNQNDYSEENFESIKRDALLKKEELKLSPQLMEWYEAYLKELNEIEVQNNGN